VNQMADLLVGRSLIDGLGPIPPPLAFLDRRVASRLRLLPPQRVARLVRDQDDVYAVEFALDLGVLNRTTADDAWAAGPSMRLGDAFDSGQAALGQPGADLTPQVVVGVVTFIYHDAGGASTGLFA
jgi:hypothetical protein